MRNRIFLFRHEAADWLNDLADGLNLYDWALDPRGDRRHKERWTDPPFPASSRLLWWLAKRVRPAKDIEIPF